MRLESNVAHESENPVYRRLPACPLIDDRALNTLRRQPENRLEMARPLSARLSSTLVDQLTGGEFCLSAGPQGVWLAPDESSRSRGSFRHQHPGPTLAAVR
jgi:hypothetical protein